MSVISLPTAVAAAVGDFSYGQLRYDAEDVSAATGAAFTSVYGPPRWAASMGAPAYLTLAEAGQWEALLLKLRGRINHLALHDLQRPRPQGNLTGNVTLAASASIGATSIALTGMRAGANLITRALDFQTYGSTGWTTTNCSITGGVADPAGGTAAFTVTSSAAGDTLFKRTYATTAHAIRNAVFTVQLKSGTYTGDVRVRIRDGAGTSLGTTTATLTTSFVSCAIWVAIGASPVADLQLEIDPVNNAAAAGETFTCYLPTLELSFYAVSNAVVRSDTLTGPVSGIPASQVLRVATGKHHLFWFYSTTAHANATFTGSVWLQSGSLSGDIRLRLRDGAGTEIATATVTPTGTWTRYSVTGTFGASPAAGVVFFIDPVDDAGAANDAFGMYGAQLEAGSTVSDFSRYATLNPGDWLQLGTGVGTSQLVKVVDAATADSAGAATVTFEPSLRYAFSAATAVTWDKPVAYYKQRGNASQWAALPAGPAMQGFALDLLEQWQ